MTAGPKLPSCCMHAPACCTACGRAACSSSGSGPENCLLARHHLPFAGFAGFELYKCWELEVAGLPVWLLSGLAAMSSKWRCVCTLACTHWLCQLSTAHSADKHPFSARLLQLVTSCRLRTCSVQLYVHHLPMMGCCEGSASALERPRPGQRLAGRSTDTVQGLDAPPPWPICQPAMAKQKSAYATVSHQ